MTEREFADLVDKTLAGIETMFDEVDDQADIDVACTRQGLLLEVAFLHNHSKIIISTQSALQELWVAAKSGGFHYQYDGTAWRNTRDQTELITNLILIAKQQSGVVIESRLKSDDHGAS